MRPLRHLSKSNISNKVIIAPTIAPIVPATTATVFDRDDAEERGIPVGTGDVAAKEDAISSDALDAKKCVELVGLKEVPELN